MDDSSDQTLALSELQLDVMRVLWRHGEAAVADVVAALADRRALAHTTVATVLSRLARRGVVAIAREGRPLVYRPLVSEHQVRRTMVSGMVNSLFAGSTGALLAHLVRERGVSPADVAAVQKLLDDEDPGHG